MSPKVYILSENVRKKPNKLDDYEGDWATHRVIMPKNKAIEYSILSWFYKKLIYRFPLFK